MRIEFTDNQRKEIDTTLCRKIRFHSFTIPKGEVGKYTIIIEQKGKIETEKRVHSPYIDPNSDTHCTCPIVNFEFDTPNEIQTYIRIEPSPPNTKMFAFAYIDFDVII